MMGLRWRYRIALTIVLLLGAYEAARPLLTCIQIGLSFDNFKICTIGIFGFDHFVAITLLVAAAAILATGVRVSNSP
jgi:hypothetical protein